MPRYCRGKIQRSSPYDSAKTIVVNQRYACEVTGKSATVGYRWGYLQYYIASLLALGRVV